VSVGSGEDAIQEVAKRQVTDLEMFALLDVYCSRSPGVSRKTFLIGPTTSPTSSGG